MSAESTFGPDLLGELIEGGRKKCEELKLTFEAAQTEHDNGAGLVDSIKASYDNIITWSTMYDSATIEAKK